MMIAQDHQHAIDLVWDYLCLKYPLKKAKIGIAFGSYDLKTPAYLADLYHQGYCENIICSGGLGRDTSGVFEKSEAVLYRDVLLKNNVPDDVIILENKSTNSGENILFTRALLESYGWANEDLLLVHKPYMTRRLYAAFRQRWPEKQNFMVAGQPLTFQDYLKKTTDYGQTKLISMLVGDLQRIMLYAKAPYFYQIPQEIPAAVMQAYHHLIDQGYTSEMIT